MNVRRSLIICLFQGIKQKLRHVISGVQRFSDARGDCLIGCPPIKF